MSEKMEAAGDKLAGAIQNNVSQALGLIYGLGMLTWTAFNQMNSNYWSYFLTEICGLEPAIMGTVKAVTGVGEWFFVIIAAIIIERFWMKHGQYRSWLLVAPPITFVCLMMTFVDPVFLDAGAKTAWMIFFQIVGGFFSSFFMIAATSIVPVISRTEADRTLLSQRKAQGNMLVKVLFAAVSLPFILTINGLVYAVPAGENAQNAGPAGFTILALIFGIIMIIMFIVMFKRIDGMDPTQKLCEERAAAKKRGEKVPPIDPGEKVSLSEMLKYWLTNLPALVGLFAEIIRFIAQMTIQSMAMYVFTYAFGDVAMAAVMLTACNITGLVATFVSEPIARKLGIRSTYLIGIAIGCVSMMACYFVGASSEMAFIACICGAYFGMNFMNGTMMGMQSNAVAYGEWRDGKTAKAFIMSTFQWCPKIGNAVAGLLTGFGLAAIGFVSGMDPSPELTQGMINIICLIPMVCFAISFVGFFFGYRLDSNKMEQIAADLAEREAAKKAAE
ncbi:MFS transporter [Adlercreutzia sp. ZJ473]|uniref:MFS transporter n=1 Tax=Adlercreutzia sp. ZJ473 TaxID=2722822 RepID=UPI001555FD15|nr:MFS transporter [Adlercreutzia sp. ZJ473]